MYEPASSVVTGMCLPFCFVSLIWLRLVNRILLRLQSEPGSRIWHMGTCFSRDTLRCRPARGHGLWGNRGDQRLEGHGHERVSCGNRSLCLEMQIPV